MLLQEILTFQLAWRCSTNKGFVLAPVAWNMAMRSNEALSNFSTGPCVVWVFQFSALPVSKTWTVLVSVGDASRGDSASIAVAEFPCTAKPE